jgi:hypothetical protein
VTPEEFIAGLRERGYRPVRTLAPPIVLLARIDESDKLYRWLQDEMGVKMTPYRLSAEVPTTYEAGLHTALVTIPPVEDEDTGDYIQRRMRAVWEAAA